MPESLVSKYGFIRVIERGVAHSNVAFFATLGGDFDLPLMNDRKCHSRTARSHCGWRLPSP